MASRICLVLGGVRSGKSAFAEKLAGERDAPTLYVATGLPSDAEMAARILRHQQSRPARWTTLEEPLDPAGRLEAALDGPDRPGVVLVDSLDIWVGNMLLELGGEAPEAAEHAVLTAVDGLLAVTSRAPAAFFLVSGEVGLSLVPPEPLGRRFQDLLGVVNQRVAAVAGQVYLVVAGIPTLLKGEAAHEGRLGL